MWVESVYFQCMVGREARSNAHARQKKLMLVIIWEFQVKPEKQKTFERIYCANGDWGKLFQRATGYLGTTLGRDEKVSGRYICTDRWSSLGVFDDFEKKFATEYAALDKECEALTDKETCVGYFENVD